MSHHDWTPAEVSAMPELPSDMAYHFRVGDLLWYEDSAGAPWVIRYTNDGPMKKPLSPQQRQMREAQAIYR
jgi:hypothetical protein